ncbi:MAG TPA: tRNA epoxyqueuosine(34) reductase QueG [Acidimicrobiales bacterium]|nr:tRNA epoxyqueuosine(34) reductase QueG [Acidimicrobiales bacterium]
MSPSITSTNDALGRQTATVEMADLAARVVAAGLGAGLVACDVTSAEPLLAARVVLEERKAAGLASSMAFTYRNPERSTDPSRIVSDAAAVVVGAWPYPTTEPRRPAYAAGRVARYAWSDQYGALKTALGACASVLESHGYVARVVADDNALVDRAIAHRAGIGWFGKNANVLVPGHGSWVVLGAVVTDAPLTVEAVPIEDGCGACRRCIDHCPTNAIVAPGVVDARRCLAWIVQAPGSIPEEFRDALGDRIYGCDDCQEVCPPNRRGGANGAAAREDTAWVDLLGLLEADDETLLRRHGRWYIGERDPRHLRRNALVALGNIGDPEDPVVHDVLDRFALSDDIMLAEHADWARRQLRLRGYSA